MPNHIGSERRTASHSASRLGVGFTEPYATAQRTAKTKTFHRILGFTHEDSVVMTENTDGKDADRGAGM